MRIERMLTRRNIICLSAFILLCIVCLKSTEVSASTTTSCPVELKGYSIVVDGTEGNISANFWNSENSLSSNVIISLFTSEPISADPSSMTTSFSEYQTKSFKFELSGIETGISASIEVMILYVSGSKMYSRSYAIPITNGLVVNDPAPINVSVFVDVDVDLDVDVNNTIYLFNNSIFKSSILATGIACVGGLYLMYNSNDSKTQTLPIEEREKIKRKKADLSKFYALAAGIATYYISSENIRAEPFQFPYGYEVFALILAGIAYFAVKMLLPAKMTDAIIRLTIINCLVSVVLIFYQLFWYLTIPLGISVACILYLIYVHNPKEEVPSNIIGKEISHKKPKGRDASFIEFKDIGGGNK